MKWAGVMLVSNRLWKGHALVLAMEMIVEDAAQGITGEDSVVVEKSTPREDHGRSLRVGGGGDGRKGSTPVRRNLSRQTPESLKLKDSMSRMARGDHPALATCYDLMGSVVFSLAVRMLRDRAAAEDVTQDIFVQVWRQSANYDFSRGSPQAWIMMIARTRVLDRLRSRSAGVILKPAGDNLPDAPAAEDWPEDLAVSREEAAGVRQALMELPDDQREAIEMAFFTGLTHNEISEKLNTPLGTIKTRIRLGLIKIRGKLWETMGEDALELNDAGNDAD